MRVLVTGASGKIGAVQTAALQAAGCDVVAFDRATGDDVLDLDAVRAAVQGCDAVVHLAAVLGSGAPEDIMKVNVLGLWHVLQASEEAGVARVVTCSSANALGIFLGGGTPDYLPLDDDHPARPHRPYGISKRVGEEMCRHFTTRTGIPTICLRPPGVFTEETTARIRARRAADPESEWTPWWEFGAFLDIRDMAAAGVAALRCPDPGHVTLLLCGTDVSSRDLTSLELVRKLLPDVEWRGGDEYEHDPYRALVDTTRAQEVLGWSPQHTWR